MQRWLRQAGALADWPAFEASWADLAMDEYMADGGRDRRRRHAVFSIARDGRITREADQPHWQSLHYNPLNGGVARWFAPVADALAGGDSLTTILRWCHAHFGAWAPDVQRWRVEVHQFRIEAVPGRPGRPTPEGMHRDGVDYVLVLMIRRTNIAEGTTTIHALDRTPLGSFTLAEPFDAALVDDARVYHGVTAVEPVDPSLPAFRDVLVVTFRAERAMSGEE
nr:2OG-Fe dioxygenase family protein [Chiayiivirga flava]